MSEVDDLVEYLIDEDEVLPDDFFIDDPAEVLDDDDDAIEKFQDVGGRYVKPCGRHDVDGGLFEVGEVDALDVEDGLHVALGELDLAVEELRGVLDEVRAEVSVDYGVATCG